MAEKKNADDRPVTHQELDGLMTAIKAEFDLIREEMATKKDLERFATKKDLERFATKEELAEVKRLQGRTLEIVEGIDAWFKQWHTIPSDVKRLKADVFELKLKVK
jgi:hypothetical protein